MIRFCLVIFLISCSSIEFKTKGKIPLEMNRPKYTSKRISFSVEREFYLWGLMPKNHVVYIDEEVMTRGYSDMVDFEIKEDVTKSDFWWNFLTLGLYQKRRFEISGFTTK